MRRSRPPRGPCCRGRGSALIGRGPERDPSRPPDVLAVDEGAHEGHTGLFVIDTGAPGRLIIGPQAIDRHNLLDGRRTRRSIAAGPVGSVAARNGTLDSVLWGGRRFENVPAKFVTEDHGAGADILRNGIVGADLIRRFVVVFDIEGERTAFLDHR